MRAPLTVTAALIAGLLAAAGVQPAAASVPRPDLPCKVVVPAKVVIGNSGGTVSGVRGTCPALLRSVSWTFDGPDGGYSFSLAYDADALYPTREMTDRIYAWEGPGRYRLRAQQTATFEDPSVGEYGEYYEVPLTATSDVVAKYLASTSVAVSHRGVGARRTTTITTRGSRVGPWDTEAAAGQAVRILRDGRLLRTGVLNASGAASWTFADTSGAHTYVAVLPETPRTWEATSRAVRG